MITVQNTENLTGITISGDYNDLIALYESIFDVIGLQDAYDGYDMTQLRCHGLCYEIRHAHMGDREIVTVDNGINEEHMKWTSRILPKENVYFSFNYLWTEGLFAVFALRDFVDMARNPKLHKNVLDQVPEEMKVEIKNRLPDSIAIVEFFQQRVLSALIQAVGTRRYAKVREELVRWDEYNRYRRYEGYYTQYIDILTQRYLDTNVKKRPTELAFIAYEMLAYSSDYFEMKQDINIYAAENSMNPENVVFKFPVKDDEEDEILW
ncbi:MAG: DUF6904 family protein [Bacillota bacterium]